MVSSSSKKQGLKGCKSRAPGEAVAQIRPRARVQVAPRAADRRCPDVEARPRGARASDRGRFRNSRSAFLVLVAAPIVERRQRYNAPAVRGLGRTKKGH